MVICVSEETKFSQIQEKLSDTAMNERNGLRIIVMGVFLTCAGLIFSAIFNNIVAYVGGAFLTMLGVFSTLFGFYVSVHYSRLYNDLLRDYK